MASPTATEKRYAEQTLLAPSSINTASEIDAATSTDNIHRHHHSHLFSKALSTSNRPLAGGIQFAGRIGGNQEFVLDRKDPKNAALLERVPDAAPYMTVEEQFSLRGFWELELWKAALIEGWGTLLLAYLTIWTSISPNILPAPPDLRYGAFNNAAFIGPVVGSILNWLALTLFTFAFSPVSGGHLNPTISLATFCARLTSLPRMVLYIVFQTGGGALAGLLVRASYDSRDFKAGGCFLFPELVAVSNAFTIEFVADMILLFLAFGVGLDPRQRAVFGPALAPVFVGGVLALLSLGTSFTRYGYGGSGGNPARCLGVMVGSHFQSWHWIHWVGPICASVVHGFFYLVVPPWSTVKPSATSKGRGGNAEENGVGSDA